MALIPSNFIDDFLDLTSSLPREIIRLLKLIREVDEKSVETNKALNDKKNLFLYQLRSGFQNENNSNSNHKMQPIINEEHLKVYTDIETKYKLAIALSQTKQEIINELHYLILGDNLSTLSSIIKKGEKECQIQTQLAYANGTLPSSSNLMYSNEPKQLLDDSFSYTGSVNKKNSERNQNEFLTKKKKRQNKSSGKSGSTINGVNITNEGSVRNDNIDNILQDIGENNEKTYCLCGGPSYGDMIECDNPYCKHQWFHYGCVGLKEAPTKNKWYCSDTCKNTANKEERILKKKKKK